MWDSVRDYWVEFNEPLEGVVNFMYLDRRGLVTTGMGNLIDASQNYLTEPTDGERAASHELAAQLVWLDTAESLVSFEVVAAEWDNVKTRFDLAPLGGGHFAPPITTLHIDRDEIDRIVTEKVDENETYLVERPEFADFDNWPADAQLALHSMAWALGPAFRFPKFLAHVAKRDWEGAAEECTFGPHVGTIIERNALDQQCFHNATRVDAEGLDPSVLLITG
jgi:GH24 family phage-related lysozyme (muramidase)